MKQRAQSTAEAVVDLSVHTNANTSKFGNPEAYDNHRITCGWRERARRRMPVRA